jgi:hypothetical protein
MTSKQIDTLLKTAAAELGTTENPTNSNRVRYNTWYYGREVSGSNYAWCSVFVTWCFYHAGLISLTWGTLNAAKVAVAEGAKNWKTLAQSKNAWVTSGYKLGDVVVFDFDGNKTIDHVGIVESVSADGKTLTCLEGNTSLSTSGSQSNGGGVFRKSRSVSIVHGAFRPDYAYEPDAPSAPAPDPNAPSDWAADAWNWAKGAGITDGTNPRGNITREQVATMLFRFNGIK